MVPERDTVEWLRMMERDGPFPAASRAKLGLIADEIERLRANVAALRASLVAGHRLAA